MPGWWQALYTHYLIQPSDQSHGLGSPYFYVIDKETGANKVEVTLPRTLVRDHIQGHITKARRAAAWGRESQAVPSEARHLLSFSSVCDLSPLACHRVEARCQIHTQPSICDLNKE